MTSPCAPTPRRRRLPRALAAIVGAGLLAGILSGCVVYSPGSSRVIQSDVIGPVVLEKFICATGGSICPVPSNSVDPGAGANSLQLLAAFRIPAAVTAPAVLTMNGPPRPGGLPYPTLAASASYSAELQRLAPAPAGEKWVGYISPQDAYRKGTDPETATLSGEFVLPGGSRTLPNRFVVGSRFVDGPNPSSRPVNCGTSLTSLNPGTGDSGQTICSDTPGFAPTAPNEIAPTRDLAVIAGTPDTARRGETAAVPFTLAFAGAAAPAATFALTATTTLPGAASTVNPPVLAPASDSTTPVSARVPVPAGAAPGTYQVTLRASVGGQVREATGALTVAAGPAVTVGGGAAAGVALSGLSISPQSISNRRRGSTTTLRASLSEAGTLRLTAERPAPGRRRAGACVAPTRQLVANGARRCTRYVKVSTKRKAGLAAGVQSITFSGRGRAPGQYRLSLVLESVAGESLPLRGRVTVRG